MGVYLGDDLLTGGGGSTAISKEVNGVTYENVYTNPKDFGYPGFYYNDNLRFGGLNPSSSNFASSASTSISSDTGNYLGPSTWSANTDVTVANITNATNGGFLHCFMTPAFIVNLSDFVFTLKITIDGTLYTWSDTLNISGSATYRLFIGAQYSDTIPLGFSGVSYAGSNNRVVWKASTATHYLPTAGAAILMSAPKLYFESSCNVVFNFNRINTSNYNETAVAAITLL